MSSSNSSQERIEFEKVIAYLILAVLAGIILLTAHTRGVFYKTDIERFIQKSVYAIQPDQDRKP
ncbi:MAG: hypothetical protein V2I56_24845 [Desulfobacteraceae bacterium]|jgi:hypothetical protein|nr:hypothetical protein [Desulfobacteraceae bacterium]